MNLKIGGNSVGKIMYGDKQVGKMYYNHELVYENMLASGTVVFDEALNISYATTTKITLKNVEIGMTNISKGLNVYFDIGGLGSETKFASVDDLKNGIILIKGKLEALKLTWIAGTNQLYVSQLNRFSLRSFKLTVA